MLRWQILCFGQSLQILLFPLDKYWKNILPSGHTACTPTFYVTLLHIKLTASIAPSPSLTPFLFAAFNSATSPSLSLSLSLSYFIPRHTHTHMFCFSLTVSLFVGWVLSLPLALSLLVHVPSLSQKVPRSKFHDFQQTSTKLCQINISVTISTATNNKKCWYISLKKITTTTVTTIP